jgi:hypothetical protein
MKIKTWIKYEEPYLPLRCRKLRYRECEEHVFINLKEVNRNELELAFEDASPCGKGEIYLYKDKLYARVKMPNISVIDELESRGVKIRSPLEYLVYRYDNCSTFFRSAYDREYYGKNTSRDAVVRNARHAIQGYILVDGVLYERTSEPRYVVNTFGLGHNHGGTGLFCDYTYNPNIIKDAYFNALQGDEAVAYANLIAQKRGDTVDVGRFKPFIVCYKPEIVKVAPNKPHGSRNELLKRLKEVFNGTDGAFEAALLCSLEALAHNENKEV